MGFDAMFYSRIDSEQKLQDTNKKQKLGVWRAAEDNFGAQKDVLSVLMTAE